MNPNLNPAPPMNYALWADRVLAALIDAGVALAFMLLLYLVIFILSLFISMIGGAIEAGTGAGIGGMLGGLGCTGGCIMFFILPPVSYFIIGLLNKVYWVSKRGYSIGQGVMKLKVVDQSGNLISMGTAALRLLCQVALCFVPVVGGLLDLLFPLFDDKTRQTLHDKAVNTFVVKTE